MILIALGANLPGPDGSTPLATCEAAVEHIKALPGLRFVALSTWYRSGAISKSTQPDYCNGVLRMAGAMAPVALLGLLQGIEQRFGRVRPALSNAPRTLDLDIIDLNGAIRALPDVILPHPRAHLRAFVLRPILDVAPDWRHPTLRRSVTSLLVDLAPQPIEPWLSQ
jgi:2-amino-4-hydroxy-6-hydroxymethyldihydropteridine diphosphokinase